MKRKEFIRKSFAGSVALAFPYKMPAEKENPFIMTVNGKIDPASLGISLPHEHIVTDFTGAEKVAQPQYRPEEACKIILPLLQQLKQQGISMLVECTPSYIGKDVGLLKMLAGNTGLHIITNTGYYAAAGHKYLPQHAYHETVQQLAARFLKEWTEGIDGTGIRPGFIKLGVDNAPLKEVDKKLIRAAAVTHLKSGLKIAIHTGDSAAAKEEFAILADAGVGPEAFIWVHAQNDASGHTQAELAGKGCWISLDGVNAKEDAIQKYGEYLLQLKKNNLLNRVLISHDDGWAVTKDAASGVASFRLFDNGNPTPYQTIFNSFKASLLQKGFTEEDFSTIMIDNPRRAFTVKICSR